jgi:hypothetical protein
MDHRRDKETLGRTAVRRVLSALVGALTAATAAYGASPTLTQIKARGALTCGVNEGLPGFSLLDRRGAWTGFDIDFCRANSAAILGDPTGVEPVPLSADARPQALRDGKIARRSNRAARYDPDRREGVNRLAALVERRPLDLRDPLWL